MLSLIRALWCIRLAEHFFFGIINTVNIGGRYLQFHLYRYEYLLTFKILVVARDLNTKYVINQVMAYQCAKLYSNPFSCFGVKA